MPQPPPGEPESPLPPEFEGLTAEDWGAWRQSPITRAFRLFLRDQVANWRQLVNELHEVGQLREHHENPDLSSDVLRGRILTAIELEALTLVEVRTFYADQAAVDGGGEEVEIADAAEAD